MSKTLTKLKLKIMTNKDLTFFMTVLFNLDVHIDNSIPTACTDGSFIKFNEPFLENLDKDEQLGLILHEIMHVVLKHHLRLGDREPKRFNHAADHAINLDLIDSGYKLPKGGLADKQYKGMTAEQIYDLLPEDDDYDESDIVFNGKPTQEDHQAIDDILCQASIEETKAGIKVAGNTCSELARYMEKLLNPKLPWQVILQDHMNAHSQDDYSLEQPDQEYLPAIYVPTLYSEGMGEINVYVDVSGSVSNHDIDVSISEIDSLKEKLNPSKLTIISFDTCIQTEVEYTSDEQIGSEGIQFTGGGGTSIGPVYKHIQETTPEVVVIITDGYYSEEPLSTEADVIFLIYDNKSFNTKNGSVIHIETGKYNNG